MKRALELANKGIGFTKPNPLVGAVIVKDDRIIGDTEARIPLDAKVLNISTKSKTIITTTEKASKQKLKLIEEKGAEIIVTPLKNNKVDLVYLIQKLGEIGIDSVLLEGGGTLNYSALEEGIVDKVITFIAPKIIGGATAKTPEMVNTMWH